MKRLFLFFLVLWLPFQSAWAALGSCCLPPAVAAAVGEGVAVHCGACLAAHPAAESPQSDEGTTTHSADDCACHAAQGAALIEQSPQYFGRNGRMHWPDIPRPRPADFTTRHERPNWSV